MTSITLVEFLSTYPIGAPFRDNCGWRLLRRTGADGSSRRLLFGGSRNKQAQDERRLLLRRVGEVQVQREIRDRPSQP